MRLFLAALAGALALASGAACEPQSPFADWAAIVVAGDDHASHTDELTETFDNARRDIAAELVRKGFSKVDILQFSVRPSRYPDTRPALADLGPIAQGLDRLVKQAPGGCLVYFTTHGAPQGVALDGYLLPPKYLARLVDRSCGQKPTVVVMSACFSGVFIPALAGPNRLILTAARRDRSSFGCSESDTYPFFDDCMLKVLPGAADFIAVGPAVQACVARREQEEGMAPPSHPQVSVGAKFRATPRPFPPSAG